MIKITQINGQSVTINAEMISHIETGSNTVITLVTGNKFVACETADEIIKKIIEYKHQIQNALPPVEKQGE
jgi:flagellar protein FlbD